MKDINNYLYGYDTAIYSELIETLYKERFKPLVQVFH